jgi:hypothetical protein
LRATKQHKNKRCQHDQSRAGTNQEPKYTAHS